MAFRRLTSLFFVLYAVTSAQRQTPDADYSGGNWFPGQHHNNNVRHHHGQQHGQRDYFSGGETSDHSVEETDILERKEEIDEIVASIKDEAAGIEKTIEQGLSKLRAYQEEERALQVELRHLDWRLRQQEWQRRKRGMHTHQGHYNIAGNRSNNRRMNSNGDRDDSNHGTIADFFAGNSDDSENGNKYKTKESDNEFTAKNLATKHKEIMKKMAELKAKEEALKTKTRNLELEKRKLSELEAKEKLIRMKEEEMNRKKAEHDEIILKKLEEIENENEKLLQRKLEELGKEESTRKEKERQLDEMSGDSGAKEERRKIEDIVARHAEKKAEREKKIEGKTEETKKETINEDEVQKHSASEN